MRTSRGRSSARSSALSPRRSTRRSPRSASCDDRTGPASSNSRSTCSASGACTASTMVRWRRCSVGSPRSPTSTSSPIPLPRWTCSGWRRPTPGPRSPARPTTARPGRASPPRSARAAAHDAWLAVARRALIAAIADERHRSATIAGLLGAAADYLGFEVDEIHHDAEGRLLAPRPLPRPGADHSALTARTRRVAAALTSIAGQHLLALEENPPYLADLGPIPRRHADRFHVTRKGFERCRAPSSSRASTIARSRR